MPAKPTPPPPGTVCTAGTACTRPVVTLLVEVAQGTGNLRVVGAACARHNPPGAQSLRVNWAVVPVPSSPA